MLALAVAMTVMSALVCLVWVSRHLALSREGREGLELTPQSPSSPSSAPKLTMIVAAKDEEANIETCLRSVLQQEYPDFEVIACDDRSTDRTPQIVDSIAAQDPRLRVIHVKELPEGWCGKNHAMHLGIQSSRGEWICMTDADCRYLSPRTLAVAMQYALDASADMVSVLPVLEMKGFWENVVEPVCSGLMVIWFRPDRVNDPAKPNAYANGAFMLIKRAAYEAVGGHEAVKDQVNEDMRLAARVKQAGLRLRVVRNRGLLLARMYTSLRGIVNGWSRIFFGTFGTLPRLTASLAALSFMGVYPYVAAAVGLGLAVAGAAPAGAWWTCGAVASAAAVMQLSVIWRFYRFTGARADLFWTYLLGSLVTIVALIGSIRKLRPGAQVVWRNTSYTRKAAAP